jgi:hypothetical protein
MIILDFTPIPTTHPNNPIPVRLHINGIEFLKNSTGPFLPLKPVSFALNGFMALQVAQHYGRAAMMIEDYGEDLLFFQENNTLRVQLKVEGNTAYTSNDEILQCWNAFVNLLRTHIDSQFPDFYTETWWNERLQKPSEQEARAIRHESWFLQGE